MIKILLAAVLIVACGCQKEEIITHNSDQIVIVTPDAGVHSFGVNTPGAWSVSMDEKSQSWCQFEGPTSGSGVGAFTVRYDENSFDGVRRGLRRQAVITVITGDGFTSKTIYFRQSGITPKVEFIESSYEFSYDVTEFLVPVNTNLSVFEAENMKCNVVGSWITSHYMTANGAEIHLLAEVNGGKEARVAEIEVSYTDAWGDTFRTTTKVMQQGNSSINEPDEPSEPSEPSDPSEPTVSEIFESINTENNDEEF